MRIALIADTFPPQRTSGAVQLRDLSLEFVRQGHAVTVLLPSKDLQVTCLSEDFNGVEVLWLKVPEIEGRGYARRALYELFMPFAMLRQFRKSRLASVNWDGVVWYSPSIFHGPLASFLKRRGGCKGYLIVRDIFPEWAVDLGLIGRGLPYLFFSAFARYQYSVADIIGVQTEGNLGYFSRWQLQSRRTLEVLPNWLGTLPKVKCSIRVNETALAKRKVFVYAGNMGVAQGMDIILDLAEKLLYRTDVGFLFVGRGSEASRLKLAVRERQLDNVLIFDEINPDEIPDLYKQCSAGIVALDPRHRTHNIPGKFLTYMSCGLPVLANVNIGNDLAQMIRDEQVGQVCENNKLSELVELTNKLLNQINSQADDLEGRCKMLFERKFSVHKIVKQITAALFHD